MNDAPIPNHWTLDAAGYVRHWWAALPAVPGDPASAAYERLRRVWFDQTRFRGSAAETASPANTSGAKPQPRTHEFTSPRHETNLTATLWENFSLFQAGDWLPRVYAATGLASPCAPISRCSWSYEWVGVVSGDKKREPMCDVIVDHEATDGSRGLLVVEAKALGKALGPKDVDGGYYMDVSEIASYGERAALLYLIDGAVREKVLGQLGPLPPRTGVLTWQELGAIQIELDLQLHAEAPIPQSVAGAIQYQFAQHNVRPATLAAEYLEREPAMSEIDSLPPAERQPMSLHKHPSWRLPG